MNKYNNVNQVLKPFSSTGATFNSETDLRETISITQEGNLEVNSDDGQKFRRRFASLSVAATLQRRFPWNVRRSVQQDLLVPDIQSMQLTV